MSQAAQAGEDIALGDACSRVAYGWAERSFAHRRGCYGEVDTSLRGSFSQVIEFGTVRLAVASDGIGTKVEVAERVGKYHTLGYDLMAMVVDDLVCSGAEPSNVSNILDVDHLDRNTVDALMEGFYCASQAAGVAIAGGEIAELGARIGGYGTGMHFNWCATGVGVIPDSRPLIDGTAVSPGNVVIGLRSGGMRSNGFSLVRRLLTEQFGSNWHDAPCCGGVTWGQQLLQPSIIYCSGVLAVVNAGLSVHGIAHVTGGGIIDNLRRVLRVSGCGATLDRLFAPHPWMTKLQEFGNIDDEAAYQLWNMGIGMVLVADSKDTAAVVEVLGEEGLCAQVIGEVVSEPVIALRTRGYSPMSVYASVDSEVVSG